MKKNIGKRNFSQGTAVAAVMGAVLMSGCGDSGKNPQEVNAVPAGVTDVSLKAYRATAVGTGSTAATQDLLTGGLGKTGLSSTGTVPAYGDPANPTADELRRNAV